MDAITEIPDDRWSQSTQFDPDKPPGTSNSRWGGFLDDVSGFDPSFFGISPREAAAMDPQQRLLLELAWEAMEDAGVPPGTLRGTPCGVFVGQSSFDYAEIQKAPSNRHLIDAYTNLGTAGSIAANRISYIFDLKGPSMTIDTACSSSLVATDVACRYLRDGVIDHALIGGINLILKSETTIGFAQASMLSPDGRCFAFDARANGYVRSDGAGVVLLKPLAHALRDEDRVYAVIKATVSNQDGHTRGITVPSQSAQVAAIESALAQAGLAPHEVQYVEAHGTGTPVGDPIEVRALSAALGGDRARPLLVGSVKTNIGHLESGAGVAGLVKAALALHHGTIPPSLHVERPNPAIDFELLGVEVVTSPTPWPEGPRYAGLNSFGFGGANAHVILGDAPPAPARSTPHPGPHLLTVSGRSEAGLRARLAQLTECLEHDAIPLADLCHTASARRDHHPYRRGVVGADRASLTAAISHAMDQPVAPVPAARPQVAFVYTGMGPQWFGMGRELSASSDVFRDAMVRCDALFAGLEHGVSVLEVLAADEEASLIDRTEHAQPAIFSIQVALTELWRRWGLRPDLIIGHSIGEAAAAWAAGALTLEQAALVIHHRSRLQAETAGSGTMLAVGLSATAVTHFLRGLEDRVAIAAINSGDSVTLAGEHDALEQIAEALDRVGAFQRRLSVEVPYHSPQMAPVAKHLASALSTLVPVPASVSMFSTASGTWVGERLLDGAYWASNVENPVRFKDGIHALVSRGAAAFLQVGPHPVLSNALMSEAPDRPALASLRRNAPEHQTLLTAAARLYELGLSFDWAEINAGKRVDLPSYPFQRQPFWREDQRSEETRIGAARHPMIGRRTMAPAPRWNPTIDTRRLPWVADHVLQGSVVFPGTGYVEMALAAGSELFGGLPGGLDDVRFEQAFFVQRDTRHALELQVDPASKQWEVFGRGPENHWIRHASGWLHRDRSSVPVIDAAALRQSCPIRLDHQACYARFERLGFSYGDSFRGIRALHVGPRRAFAEIEVPASLSKVEAYSFHPAVLDACLQLLAGAAPELHGLAVPVAIRRMRVHGTLTRRIQCFLQLHAGHGQDLVGDLLAFDEEGRLLIEMEDLTARCTELSRPATVADFDPLLYSPRWVNAPLDGKHDASWIPRLDQLAAAGGKAPRWQVRRVDIGDGEAELEALATDYIVSALRNLGWQPALADRFTATELGRSLGVDPQHDALLARYLGFLVVDGVLGLEAGSYEVRRDPGRPEPSATWRELYFRYPASQAELRLLRRCGSHLADALAGKMSGVELIFVDGSSSLLEHLYQHAPSVASAAAAVQSVIEALDAARPVGRPLRILEVGAGTGGLTAAMVRALPDREVDYCFTDVSPLFLQRAKERFQDLPFLRFEIFDLEQPAQERGLAPGSFDVILGLDVLHVMSRLDRALEAIGELLAPDGVFVLAELVERYRTSELFFGMLPGWWSFQGDPRRDDHALLSPSDWKSLLQEHGFREVVRTAAPDPSARAVFLARRPRISASSEPRKEESAAAPTTGQRWVVFEDAGGVGAAMTERLRTTGAEVITLREADAPDEAHLARILGGSLHGVLHLWNLDVPDGKEAIAHAESHGTFSIARLAQAIPEKGRAGSHPLVIVTRQAWAVDGPSSEPAAALAWGLGRSLRNERVDLDLRLLDIDDEADVDALWTEIRGGVDDEVALRGSRRFVRRLNPTALRDLQREAPPRDCRMVLTVPGLVESLSLFEVSDDPLPEGWVSVDVASTSLNFKDVTRAVGLLAESRERAASASELGQESAGVVRRVGPGVDGVEVGDRVLALVGGGLGSVVRCPAALVAKLPDDVTFDEAAAIGMVFLTAYHALLNLARLRPDETVLVHSGTGGVGLSVIQLAHSIGARVMATAGSAEKREMLLALGAERVGDSRSLAFVDDARAWTDGRGVDVVVNSLAGDALHASLNALAPYGRFVELGRRDMEEGGRLDLHPFLENRAFFGADVDALRSERPEEAGAVMRGFLEDVARGRMRTLPYRRFPLSETVPALRALSRAEHTGKFVISTGTESRTVVPAAAPKLSLPGTHVITGGLGGLGFALAQWLVACGARHVALLGRRGLQSESDRERVEALGRAGADVRVWPCDVSDSSRLAAVLAEVRATMPPVHGVFHLAMVLRDEPVARMSAQTLHEVLAPKAWGAFHLHRLTESDPLEHFVCFSSVSAELGTLFQGSYAAANTMLDALAHHRRALGKPALSIDWGAVAEVGVVAETRETASFLASLGVDTIPVARLLAVLGEMMRNPAAPPQLMVSAMDHARLIRAMPRLRESPKFERLTESLVEATMGTGGDEVDRKTLIRREVAAILGNDPKRVRDDMPLVDQGLDSLMAVELSNRLRNKLGIEVATMTLLEHATVTSLEERTAREGDRSASAESESSESVDLDAEAQLDASIAPTGRDITHTADPQMVVVTGAAGFIGAHLVHRLLEQTSAEIQCVVRDRGDGARARLLRALDGYGLTHPDRERRLKVVDGDVAFPRFGLDASTWESLAEADHIYHAAARLNFALPYRALRGPNVVGVREALRLGATGRLTPVHHLSSFPVVGQPGGVPAERGYSAHYLASRGYDVGYIQTKWVADQLVTHARDRGLPVTTYRPGLVAGHSGTGVWNTEDVTCRIIKGCILLGTAPDQDQMLDLVPVDYVAAAVVNLSLRESSLGRGFNMANPAPVSWRWFVGWLREQGYDIELVPSERWHRQVSAGRLPEDNPLRSLVPYFQQRPLDRPLVGYREHARAPRLLARLTTGAALEGQGVLCPPLDRKLLGLYVSFLQSTGFLPLP